MCGDVRAAELVDRQRAAVAELDARRLEPQLRGVRAACRCRAARASTSRSRPSSSTSRTHVAVLGVDRRRAAVLDHVHARVAGTPPRAPRPGRGRRSAGSGRGPRRASRASRSARRSRRTRSRSARRPARPGARAGRAARTPGGWSAPGWRRGARTAARTARRRCRRAARRTRPRGRGRRRCATSVFGPVTRPRPGSTRTFMPSIRSRTPRLWCSATARARASVRRRLTDGKPCDEVEPVLLGAGHLEHRVGRRQQRLRRDRVGHRAVPAELIVLDQRDLGAQVRGGRGGGVPGGSAA